MSVLKQRGRNQGQDSNLKVLSINEVFDLEIKFQKREKIHIGRIILDTRGEINTSLNKCLCKHPWLLTILGCSHLLLSSLSLLILLCGCSTLANELKFFRFSRLSFLKTLVPLCLLLCN